MKNSKFKIPMTNLKIYNKLIFSTCVLNPPRYYMVNTKCLTSRCNYNFFSKACISVLILVSHIIGIGNLATGLGFFYPPLSLIPTLKLKIRSNFELKFFLTKTRMNSSNQSRVQGLGFRVQMIGYQAGNLGDSVVVGSTPDK